MPCTGCEDDERQYIHGAPHRAHVRRKMCNYSTATFSLLRAFHIIFPFLGSCSEHTFALVISKQKMARKADEM